MRILVAVLLCGVLAASGAFIDLPAQTYDLPVGDGPDVTLYFNPFDDAGGTRVLTAVTLRLDAALSAQAAAENTSDRVNTLTLRLYDGEVLASAPAGLEVTAGLGGFTPVSVTVQPTDGITGSGPDYHDFGLVSTSVSGQSASLGSGLGPFIGPDAVPVVIDAGGAFGVGGSAELLGTITSFRTSGAAALRYTFDPVFTPEPGTLLLGLGGLLSILRRRPRA